MGRLPEFSPLEASLFAKLVCAAPSKTRHAPINASYCRRNCLSDGQVKQRIALLSRTALPGHQTPRTHAFAEHFVLAGQLVELSRKLQGRLPWRVGSVLKFLPDIPSRARRACIFSDVLQLHVSKTCCRALRLHASSVRDAFQDLARNVFQPLCTGRVVAEPGENCSADYLGVLADFQILPSRARSRGVYLFACVAVACVQDMLQGIALAC